MNKYSKVPGLLDAPITEPQEDTQVAVCHYTNGSRIHEYLQEVKEILSQYDVMTVGELPSTPDHNEILRYISGDSAELDMVFNFDTVQLGKKVENRLIPQTFSKADFKHNLTKWQTLPELNNAWTSVFLENHDQGRSVSRFASDLPEYRVASAKVLATVLCTMSGTLFIYQGQEIGMINTPESWSADEYKCVRSVNYYKDVAIRTNNNPKAMLEAHKNLRQLARDHARVPMQWNGSKNAGFCSEGCRPWMSVLESSKDINVANQLADENSVLSYWRRLLALRKEHSRLFTYGNFRLLHTQENILAFLKNDVIAGKQSLTVANLSDQQQKLDIRPDLYHAGSEILIGTDSRKAVKDLALSLEPFEAFVLMLT